LPISVSDILLAFSFFLSFPILKIGSLEFCLSVRLSDPNIITRGADDVGLSYALTSQLLLNFLMFESIGNCSC
jgi:hypothetical protein